MRLWSEEIERRRTTSAFAIPNESVGDLSKAVLDDGFTGWAILDPPTSTPHRWCASSQQQPPHAHNLVVVASGCDLLRTLHLVEHRSFFLVEPQHQHQHPHPHHGTESETHLL